MYGHVRSVVRIELLLDEDWLAVIDNVAETARQSRSELIRTSLWQMFSPALRRPEVTPLDAYNDGKAQYLGRIVRETASVDRE